MYEYSVSEDGGRIKVVNDFMYVGSIVSAEDTVLKDVSARITKPYNVFIKLNKI